MSRSSQKKSRERRTKFLKAKKRKLGATSGSSTSPDGLEEMIDRAVGYLAVATACPATYYRFVLSEKAFASAALESNPDLSHGHPTRKFLDVVPQDRDECAQAMEDKKYSSIFAFYEPGACLDSAVLKAHLRGVDPALEFRARVMCRLLKSRPLIGDAKAILHEAGRAMRSDADGAWHAAAAAEGSQRLYAVKRWVYSTLASRLGYRIQYRVDDYCWFERGGTLKTWIEMPLVTIGEVANPPPWRLLEMMAYAIMDTIVSGASTHVMVPSRAVVLAEKLRTSNPFISTIGNCRVGRCGLIEICQDMFGAWGHRDDEKLADILDSRFVEHWWEESRHTAEQQFAYCLQEWATRMFVISGPAPVKLNHLECSAIDRVVEKSPSGTYKASAQLFASVFKLMAGKIPNLPGWLSSAQSTEIREQLGPCDDVSTWSAEPSMEGFVYSLEASGHIGSLQVKKPGWHSDLLPTAMKHMDAAEFNFQSYVQPVSVSVRAHARPEDCRSLFSHCCLAVEAELWHRIFLPALDQIVDSGDCLSSVKDQHASTAGEARVFSDCVLNHADKSTETEKLTLVQMGRITKAVLNCILKYGANAEFGNEAKFIELESGIDNSFKAFLTTPSGGIYIKSIQVSDGGMIWYFGDRWRNLEAHPNKTVSWEDALLGRRIAHDLLRWLVECIPDPTGRSLADMINIHEWMDCRTSPVPPPLRQKFGIPDEVF